MTIKRVIECKTVLLYISHFINFS